MWPRLHELVNVFRDFQGITVVKVDFDDDSRLLVIAEYDSHKSRSTRFSPSSTF